MLSVGKVLDPGAKNNRGLTSVFKKRDNGSDNQSNNRQCNRRPERRKNPPPRPIDYMAQLENDKSNCQQSGEQGARSLDVLFHENRLSGF